MEEKNNQFHGNRFLLAGACFVIIISGLKAAKAICIPFMLALFLAILASGPVYWLKNRKFPNWLAILLVTVSIVFLFASGVYFFANSANQFSSQIENYSFNKVVDDINAYLLRFDIDARKVTENIDLSSFAGVFSSTLKSTVQAVSSFFLVIVMMVFMILEAASFRYKISKAFNTNFEISNLDEIAIDVQRYIFIKTLTCALTGLLVWFWVSVFGLDFSVLWGITAFILNYIPFIGSIVAAVPAVILAWLQFDPAIAITLAIGYIIINIGISNFLEPLLMGQKLGLSVLVVFISLIFWGWVWGPLGALISVPLTMILKIFLNYSPQLRWLSVLMGSNKEKNS